MRSGNGISAITPNGAAIAARLRFWREVDGAQRGHSQAQTVGPAGPGLVARPDLAGGMDVNIMLRTLSALAVFNGELIAAGDFSVAGGISAHGIARWNGTAAAICSRCRGTS